MTARFMHLGFNRMANPNDGESPSGRAMGTIIDPNPQRRKMIGVNNPQNNNENYNPAMSFDNIGDLPQAKRYGSVTNRSMNSPNNQRQVVTSLFTYDQIKPRYASVNTPMEKMQQQQINSRNFPQLLQKSDPQLPFPSDGMKNVLSPKTSGQFPQQWPLSFNHQQYQGPIIMPRLQGRHQTINYPTANPLYYPTQGYNPLQAVNSHSLVQIPVSQQLDQVSEKQDEAEYLRSRNRKLHTVLGSATSRHNEEIMTESQKNSLIYNLDYQMQILQGGDQTSPCYQQRTPKNLVYGYPSYQSPTALNVGIWQPVHYANSPQHARPFKPPEGGFSDFLMDNYPNMMQPSYKQQRQGFEGNAIAKSLESLDRYQNGNDEGNAPQNDIQISSLDELETQGYRRSNLSSLRGSITTSPTKPRGSIISSKRHDSKVFKRKTIIRDPKTTRTVVIKPPPRKKLQALLWLIAYGPLILQETHQRVHRRKMTSRKTILDAYSAFNNDAQKFFLDNAKPFFEALYNEKKPMTLIESGKKGFFGSKKLSQKDMEGRVQNIIMPKLRALLNAIITKVTSDSFPESLACFIASISENQCTPPDRFLFDFEIKRLNFSYFGTLKNMAELHSKMIIGMFLLIRVFIFQFLVSPWNQLCNTDLKLPKDDLTKKNLKTIASILYHIVMDIFRGKVPVVANNQRFLPTEMKIRPRPQNLKIDGMEEGTKISDEDVLEGLYSKKELGAFFSLRFHDVNQLKGLFEEFLNRVYKLTHKVHLENKGSNKGSQNDIE